MKLSDKIELHQKNKTLSFINRLLTFLILVCLFFGALVVFNLTDLVELLELKTYDLRVAMTAKKDVGAKPSPEILIVEFDDATQALYQDELGYWPWPRRLHSNMIDFINGAQAKAIAYNIFFSGQTRCDGEKDDRFVETFRKYPNVYLMMTVDNQAALYEQVGIHNTAQQIQEIQPLSVRVKPSVGAAHTPIRTFNHFQPLMSDLLSVGDRIALDGLEQDMDTVHRTVPVLYRLQSKKPKSTKTVWVGDSDSNALFFPSLPLKLVMDLKQASGELPKGSHTEMTLTPQGHLVFPGHDIPLLAKGGFLVRWYPKTMRKEGGTLFESDTESDFDPNTGAHALAQKKMKHQEAAYPTIPAWRVMKAMENQRIGRMTAADQGVVALLKHKIVFIGTAFTTSNYLNTPVGKVPGVYLMANVFDNLYQNQGYLHRASNGVNFGMTALLSLVGCLILLKLRSAIAGLMMTVTVALTYLLISLLLFQYNDLWLNQAMPMVALMITSMITLMMKYMNRDQDYEQTYQLATTDGKTGLYNHSYFQEHLVKSIDSASRYQSSFSLLMIDIDFFKKVNDSYGHQVGDEVLRLVAERLKESVRKVDLVARYGGEEMAIILDKANEIESMEIANNLVQRIGEETFSEPDGVPKKVTISVGVATFPVHGNTAAQLIEFADKALYRAKQNGRNQVGAQTSEDPPIDPDNLV